MSSPSRRLAVVCGALGVLLVAGVLEAETLTLEEVVRLHVSGVGDSALIARIRTADVDFDLSDAMLAELRTAGLSEALIAAMVARQNELHPPPPAAPAATDESTTAGPTLVLHVRAGATGKSGPLELRFAATAPGAEKDAAAAIDDAALWVACVRSTHVPDHWRTESPLGRDFVTAPRHRMLHFLSGASGDGGAGASTLRLAIPETIEVTLDPDDGGHQLVIGVAVHAGERWLATAMSSPIELETSGGAAELAVSIAQRGSDPQAVLITIERPVSDPARAK